MYYMGEISRAIIGSSNSVIYTFRGSMGEQRASKRQQINEIGISAQAKWRRMALHQGLVSLLI